MLIALCIVPTAASASSTHTNGHPVKHFCHSRGNINAEKSHRHGLLWLKKCNYKGCDTHYTRHQCLYYGKGCNFRVIDDSHGCTRSIAHSNCKKADLASHGHNIGDDISSWGP